MKRTQRVFIVVLSFLVLVLTTLFVWQDVVLTPDQHLKTKYFVAVCDIEPYWFIKGIGNKPVADVFKDEIAEMTTTLQEVGEDPHRATEMVSYLLDVYPEGLLWYNTPYLLNNARSNGLLDEHFRPTIGPAEAAKRGAYTHRQYHRPSDLDSLRNSCPTIIFGLVIGGGTPA